MAKYRKIESHIWRDAKFRTLDEGSQLLFFYLLTNPNLSMVGTLDMTIGMVSEALGKSTDTVSKRFQNLINMGSILYDKCGLIWVKNYLKYNEPQNPKMAIGIAASIEDLPECDLVINVVKTALSVCERFKGIEQLETLSKQYRNSIETVSISVTETVTVTETEKKDIRTRKSASEDFVLEVKKPDCVSADQWKRYLKLRKEKRLPLTVEAWELIENEAAKASKTIPEVITICLENAWASFRASWLQRLRNDNPGEFDIEKFARENPGLVDPD